MRYGTRRPDGGPPEAIGLAAEHEIFVILVDERMARRVRASDRPVAEAWAKLATDLVTAHGPGTMSPHRVVPVALDAAALQLTPQLNTTSFVRLDVRKGAARDRHLTLHVAVPALRALHDLPPPADQAVDRVPHIPVRLFISHAKGDLPRDPAALAEGPVKAILAALAEVPVDGWYDARNIPAGGRFDEEIKRGVLTSSALVAVLTDSWSTREWCRREVLEAKVAGRPMVVVDALEGRVIRLFPYLGNAPTLRWRAAIASPDATAGGTEADWTRQRRLWEAEDAALVIEAALLEALRYRHDHERLLGRLGAHEVALGTPPEALTLAHLPAGTTRVWYPDPPLGREELERLQPVADAQPSGRLELTTPLSELARWERPAGVQTVAVSLSGAPDSERYGGSAEHLAIFADDIVLYLLLAGLRVAYGGVLGHDALRDGAVEGDGVNYVERLLAMARSYSPLVTEIAAAPPKPIQNWVAWPIHCRYGDDEYRTYGQEAELESLAAPPDLEVGRDALKPAANGFFAPDTPARRYAWARSLTFMRESMREATSARILLGGKLTNYQGLWPGVFEEGVIALRTRQPLYPLGVFGGAARLLIDLLQGVDREEMTAAWFAANMPHREELVAEYRRHGRAVETPEALAAELKRAGAGALRKR